MADEVVARPGILNLKSNIILRLKLWNKEFKILRQLPIKYYSTFELGLMKYIEYGKYSF